MWTDERVPGGKGENQSRPDKTNVLKTNVRPGSSSSGRAVNFHAGVPGVAGCTLRQRKPAAASPRREYREAAVLSARTRSGRQRAGDMEIVAINRSRHELFHYKAARCGSITQPLATTLLCAPGGAPTCSRGARGSAAADRRRNGGPRLTTIASREDFSSRDPRRGS